MDAGWQVNSFKLSDSSSEKKLLIPTCMHRPKILLEKAHPAPLHCCSLTQQYTQTRPYGGHTGPPHSPLQQWPPSLPPHAPSSFRHLSFGLHTKRPALQPSYVYWQVVPSQHL